MLPARRLAVLTLLAVLPLARAAWAQDVRAGEAVFKRQCSICHSILPGDKVVGPSLFGVIGRGAGTVPDFRYSEANRSSGITWNAATLEPYLTDPRAVMPGTRMSFGGLKDSRQRADLIAYLATLR